jgi:hypothetical protein
MMHARNKLVITTAALLSFVINTVNASEENNYAERGFRA